MSKLIKSGNVVLDHPMELVSILYPAPAGCMAGAAEPDSGDDQDSKVDRIKMLKFKARESYERARKQGGIEGYADGLRRGRLQGERQKEEASQNAAESVQKLKDQVEIDYRQTAMEVNRETLDFALTIVSKVLNDTLEEHQSYYSTVAQPGAALSVCSDTGEPGQQIEGQPVAAVAVQTQEGRPITLEEILILTAKGRMKLLEKIDMRDVVASLKLADKATVQIILDNLSERMQDAIREEISLSGPLLAEDAVKARIRIGKVYRRLRTDGEL